jgi:L-fuconolactonase
VTVIDAHHHVWNLDVRDQPWITGEDMAPIRRSFSVDDLRPVAAAAGVTATVMVQTVTVAEETPEMLAMAAADPLVRGVVGWIDLTGDDVGGELARLAELPGGDRLVGIRHQVQDEPDPDWLRRGDVIAGLRELARAGLTYDLVVRPHQLASAAYVAEAVPDLQFVLDHAGKPPIATGALEPWATAVRELAAWPNTVAKLSGLVTEAAKNATASAFQPFAEVLMTAFGPDRLMFGSDWPVCLLASDYHDVVRLAETLTAGLSKSERTAVFAGTAARVYRIDDRLEGEQWH